VTAYLLRKDIIEERRSGGRKGGREEERKRNIAVYFSVTPNHLTSVN
jgi:hypothetical protein